jgi:GNAT superfamily N-acetyltransferase
MGDEHLTTGWEPAVPAADSLLRRYVLASAGRAAFMARCAGGPVGSWDDLVAADPRSPVLWDNAAVLMQPPPYADMDDVLTRLTSFYPPERHFVFLSPWPTGDLSGAGLELMGHPPLMLRPAGGVAPPVPEGLEIVRVHDERTMADFVRTIVTAYPMPGAEGTVLADAGLLDGPVSLFVGYLGGGPVATSGAYASHGIVDVEWVSAMPECRGRGVGGAMVWAATAVNPADPAMLIASDEGQPVYERLGYLRMQRLTMWHRPPAG